MMHTIPREYTKDARLITLYNNAFKEGYYRNVVIVDTRDIKTDEERLAYAHGLRAGRLRRKEVDENEQKVKEAVQSCQ